MSSFFIDPPELFKNIAQLEYAGKYYDFHNEFVCTKLLLQQESFTLNLKHSVTGLNVKLIFKGVTFTMIDFSYEKPVEANFTLDNLYRGRYEINGNLYEYDNKDRSYYYLEFYEGHKIEFFCVSLQLKESLF